MSVQALAGGVRAKLAVAGLVLVMVAGTACSGPGASFAGREAARQGTPTATKPAAPPAVLALVPRAGTRNISPLTPIRVRVSAGTLDSVRLVNEAGRVIGGTLSADRHTWQTT